MFEVLVGGAITLLATFAAWWLSLRRERESREAERQERLAFEHRQFQRETLVRLQDLVSYLYYPAVRPRALEISTYGYGGRVLPEGWVEQARMHLLEISSLSARLDDDDLRQMLTDFRGATILVLDGAENPLDFGEGLMTLTTRLEPINERIGELLRELRETG